MINRGRNSAIRYFAKDAPPTSGPKAVAVVALLEAVLGTPIGVDGFLSLRVARRGVRDGYPVRRAGQERLTAPEDEAENHHQQPDNNRIANLP